MRTVKTPKRVRSGRSGQPKPMKDTNLKILEALETLAAAFPWEPVEIDIVRSPEGKLLYRAWLNNVEQFGFPCRITHGDTVEGVVAEMIQYAKDNRDPEEMRKRKIAELKEQIAKLEAVLIGLPPYRPNRELALLNLPDVPATITV